MRVYAVSFQAVAVAAAQDLFEISPAANRPVKLLGVQVGQYTDTGDAQEEMLRWAVIRGFTVSGSGGTSATPVPLTSPLDTAAGFSAEVNNTTVANTGTAVTIAGPPFNIRVGLDHFWTPETQPIATAANTTIVIRLVAAPADSVTCDGVAYVAELA